MGPVFAFCETGMNRTFIKEAPSERDAPTTRPPPTSADRGRDGKSCGVCDRPRDASWSACAGLSAERLIVNPASTAIAIRRRFSMATGSSPSTGLWVNAIAVIGFPAHGAWRQVEKATAARDVPVGHSWAFRDHRTMAEVIAAETQAA
jgi:hypothetical protein